MWIVTNDVDITAAVNGPVCASILFAYPKALKGVWLEHDSTVTQPATHPVSTCPRQSMVPSYTDSCSDIELHRLRLPIRITPLPVLIRHQLPLKVLSFPGCTDPTPESPHDGHLPKSSSTRNFTASLRPTVDT